MNFSVDEELAWRLLISFCIGTAIGFEREYRSKAAGLRTMIMICLGSTMFTELSVIISPSTPDRIASNIVTGIGFLGAGVIFKDGLTVTGITTATTIWISAALGMAVGAGEYFIAIFGSIGVLIVLSLFEKFQYLVELAHQSRTYKISLEKNSEKQIHLEKTLDDLKIHWRKRKELKEPGAIILYYEVSGKERRLEKLNHFLRTDHEVKAFEY